MTEISSIPDILTAHLPTTWCLKLHSIILSALDVTIPERHLLESSCGIFPLHTQLFGIHSLIYENEACKIYVDHPLG
jgi:hypothetical protein